MRLFTSLTLLAFLLGFELIATAQITETAFDYKYAYHKNGKFYVHGELVSSQQYKKFILQCDCAAEVKKKLLDNLRFIAFDDFSNPPKLLCDDKNLSITVSGSDKHPDLTLWQLQIHVNRPNHEIEIQGEQGLGKIFKENYTYSLSKLKIDCPAAFTFFWKNPDGSRVKLAVSWHSPQFTIIGDTAVNFEKYSTFAYISFDPLGKSLIEAFKKELKMHGLREETAAPDLVVQLKYDAKQVTALDINKDSRTIGSSIGSGGAVSGGRGGRGGGGQRSRSETTTTWTRDTTVYFERRLTLIVKDRKSYQTVWSCTLLLEPGRKAAFIENEISNGTVARAMKLFPKAFSKHDSHSGAAAVDISAHSNQTTIESSGSGNKSVAAEEVNEIQFISETTSGTMGYVHVTIHADTVYTESQWNLAAADKTIRKRAISTTEWHEICQTLSGYKMNDLVDLPSPTQLRTTGQANKSKIEIRTNHGSYMCGWFDADNPHQKLKKLMAYIALFEDNR